MLLVIIGTPFLTVFPLMIVRYLIYINGLVAVGVMGSFVLLSLDLPDYISL